MNIINCTPHEVNLVSASGCSIAVFPPSGDVARVASVEVAAPALEIDGVAVETIVREFGEVSGLPAPAPDTLYIVSSMARAAITGRDDLLVPHDFARDEAGNIIGCRRFAR